MQSEPASSNARRWLLRWLLLLIVGLALCLPFDQAIFRQVIVENRHVEVKLRDWNEAWRVTGWAPLWWFLALAAWLVARDQRKRGVEQNSFRIWPMVFAPAIAGLLSEAIKLLVRRARPSLERSEYVFRAFSDGTFDGNGFGMPSSETAVAFAGGYLLYRAYPAAWPIWLFFAAGCGLQRMFDGKHYASDTFVGAMLGIACARLAWESARRRA